jgi:hypothetical protein
MSSLFYVLLISWILSFFAVLYVCTKSLRKIIATRRLASVKTSVNIPAADREELIEIKRLLEQSTVHIKKMELEIDSLKSHQKTEKQEIDSLILYAITSILQANFNKLLNENKRSYFTWHDKMASAKNQVKYSPNLPPIRKTTISEPFNEILNN